MSCLHAAVMIPGGAPGEYVGVWLARCVPQALIRRMVVVVGLLLGYLLLR